MDEFPLQTTEENEEGADPSVDLLSTEPFLLASYDGNTHGLILRMKEGDHYR